MILEALQWLVEQHGRPRTLQLGEKTMIDAGYQPEPSNLPAHPLPVSTLSAVAAYVNNPSDGPLLSETLVVVSEPSEVRVVGILDEFGRRGCYLKCEADIPRIPFGQFIEREAFQILLASAFVDTLERANLLELVSTIVAGQTRTTTDNGFTQEVAVKRGIGDLRRDRVTPYFNLAPFSSFPEIEQVERSFLVRLKDDGGRVHCALFEADGGAWRVEAKKRVAAWLKNAIADSEVTILA